MKAIRIIIVDDEHRVLMGLKRQIQEVAPHAEIMAFEKPVLALQYAQEQKLDVAFLDIKMPKMNGIELAKHLQQVNPSTNIIFVSASKDNMNEAWEIHASGYVLKPVRDETIVEELDNLRHGLE